jgi:tRNA(fMet)-specific endonuclease VapC
VTDIVLCSVVVYELRHGAESSADPPREHTKLDVFLAPFSSLPFDDASAVKCAEIRRALERKGARIGPHDLQIAAIALRHDLTLVTHNTREFGRISAMRLEDWES